MKFCFPVSLLLLLSLGPRSTYAAKPELPASDAFQQWAAGQRNLGAAAFKDPQAVNTGFSLAKTRFDEMRALLKHDPQEFVRHAMAESERSQLPSRLQALVENRIQSRGFFGVYCAGVPKDPAVEPAQRPTNSGYAYEVRINGTTYRAFVFGKWRDQTTVMDAAIEGVALGDAIAVGDSPTPTEQTQNGQSVSAYSPTTTGPNTLLYMIARFSDQTSDPIDDATVYSQMTVISNFWMNCSAGTVYIHGLANPTQVVDIVHITLPQPASYASNYNNNFSQLLSDARSAASAKGFNYANYNLDVVVTTGSGFGYAGIAWIAAQGSHWVQNYTSLRTGGHELGHNLGLYHANYWRTDSTQPFGKDSNPGGYAPDSSNGEWVEYGHYFSVMSAQYGGEWDDATKPIYNPVEKVRLGWLSGNQVQYITTSGTYRLYRHDARLTVGVPRGIRIEPPATDYTGYARRYWLGYRYAPWSTAQSWYQNGVEVDVTQTSYGSDGSILLDMTPYSKDDSSGASWTDDNTDKIDGALIVGRTYDDNTAGIHITPVATGSDGAGEEYIDMVINLGSFPGNHPPVISSLNASSAAVSPGQSVNFSVSASDPDGDTLAYSWDFNQVQVWTASGLNSATATKSWTSAGQYRVTVTVSDRKGGVAAESQIITVGSPASIGQVWGRVVWGGQPVYRARVSTTSGSQVWTDSDGTYVLSDLTPGNTYMVNCQFDGLTFTPQFSNPVSLAATNAYGIDFYADQPVVGGGGAVYAVSGQVTDGSSGVAGAEVRGGGMVATTDAGGNYVLSNLLNGTYTLTPGYNNWSFSPATRSVAVNSANSSGNNFSRAAPYSISGQFSGIPAGAQNPAPIVYLSNGRWVQATKAGSGQNRYWTYSLNNIAAGQFSLGAELSGYNIVPSGFSNPLTVSGNLTGMNFSGSSASVVGGINGRITQLGLPLSGATVQLSQGGSTVATMASDSDGYYRFENLANGSYTIIPTKSGYSFSPVSFNVSFVPSSGNNFAATGLASPPLISSVTANPGTVPGAGATTTLSALASGTGTLMYSWDATLSPGPVSFSPNGSSSAFSTLVSFQAPGSYMFRARVTDASGLATTSNVNVTVSAGPGSMVIAPFETQVPGGQTVSFHADAWDQLGNRITVSPAWSVNGGGTIDSSGLFTATTMGGPFSVTAVAAGLSATGFVWVTSPGAPVAPSISAQPTGTVVAVNSNATFNVQASGTQPLAYQWLFNGDPISGATTSIYTRIGVQSGDEGLYSVLVTNVAAAVISSNALLTVIHPPVITNQPISLALSCGSLATFSVVAGGTAPLTYQWEFDGADIPGATSSSYARSNVQHADSGNYSVRVANGAGQVSSSNALLTVPLAVTIATFGSSTNPSLPGQAVAFTLTLTAVAPAVGTPTGTIRFKVDGTAAGNIVPLNAGIASYTTATLSHGTHIISAEYAGDANFMGSTNALASPQLVNTPPVAGADIIIRNGTNEAQVSIAALLSNDSDPDGDALTFLSVSALSVNGGTVISNNGSIHYIPPSGSTNSDSFTYTITDAFAASSTGTVTVNLNVDNGPPPNLTITPLGGGSYDIRGDGVPGFTYRIEFADSPGATWQPLGNATADALGVFRYTDIAGSPQRFYRSIYP